MTDWHSHCECGKVAFRIHSNSDIRGSRIICCCESCRAADIYLRGDARGLTAEKGVEIFQTTPDRVVIDEGIGEIRAIRLSEKGINRWYTQCCGAPLFNTLTNPKTPFIGVVIQPEYHDPVAPILGDAVVVRRNSAPRDALFRHKDGSFIGIAAQIVARMIGAKFRKGTNPLVKADGAFIAIPEILDAETRKSAYEAAK